MSQPSRRTFLKAGAVTLALSLLDALAPRSARASAAEEAQSPRRMVLLHRPLGTYHPYLVPEKAGADYVAPRYLQKLERHRTRMTLLSGISHRGYPNSHHTEPAIFTGVAPERIARADDIHNSVSLDQVAAEKVASQTRVPSLTLNTANCASLSWNRNGVPIPWERSKTNLFRRLFLDGSPDEIERELQRLAHGRSILDGMRDQLRTLSRDLGMPDRDRLEVLTSSIREAEASLLQEEAWIKKPKPKVEAAEKEFERAEHWIAGQQQWYRLVHLALQTDSTRVIVLGLGEHGQENVPDLSINHHDASHHGKDPSKIEQFARYEEKEYDNLAGFLDKLVATTESGGSLLDRTQVLIASNLGDASAHAGDNLPVILAGGGYQHRGHLPFDAKNNYPLSNLYVRMLQQFGLEVDRFGSSEGVLSELG